MTIGRSLFSLVTLADGRLMAVGGMVADDEEDGDDCEGCSTEVDTAELYDPATNRWTPTSAVELKTPDDGSADQLVDVVALAGGQVLAIGANDSSALYDPRTETWTAVAWPRVGGAIALPDGTALGFGVDYYSGDSDAHVPFVERFDPEGGTPSHRPPLAHGRWRDHRRPRRRPAVPRWRRRRGRDRVSREVPRERRDLRPRHRGAVEDRPDAHRPQLGCGSARRRLGAPRRRHRR